MVTARKSSFVIILISICLVGCVQNVRPYSIDDAGFYTPSKVIYATNRNITGKQNLNTFYGSKRSELQFGIATVAIPKN